jgi:hypothetical protein
VSLRDERGQPLRKSVKLDSYAPWQVRREFGLTSNELMVLLYMTLTADWRSGCWSGTIKDIADDTSLSRNTVRKAIDGLVSNGSILILTPFRQGEFGNGVVELPLYEWMVVLHPSHVESRNSARLHSESDRANAYQTRTNRAPIAQVSRNPARLEDDEQVVRDGPRYKAIREEGEGVLGEPKGVCRYCDEPIAGHPFSDHEPAPKLAAL